MNKTYRKIFNAVRGVMVAVSENTSAASQFGACTVENRTGGGRKPL